MNNRTYLRLSDIIVHKCIKLGESKSALWLLTDVDEGHTPFLGSPVEHREDLYVHLSVRSAVP